MMKQQIVRHNGLGRTGGINVEHVSPAWPFLLLLSFHMSLQCTKARDIL